ncbi:DUF4307 domain-containing protein [Corynebacterium sp.]|uniref:DUF4307 domain-containing protein n=1 Tax=Corynebacterium sp. TaxID=1720 RepID=UPI00199117A9|nr:DUF4307 domain-containing protein [Corynebacterium sp.]HHU67402.1 DUF4307 domain-containing protein [Corynebacterium sp.]HKM25283.1 DUF4307 domain-containing protein [Corynebacterium sp.]
MSTPAANPTAERYGSDRSPGTGSNFSGKMIAIVTVVLMAGLAVAIARYMAADAQSGDVRIEMVSHERTADDNMRLWVDVTRKDPDVLSYCIVTALNYEMAEVGRREILVEPGGDALQRFQVDIPSRDLPVSGSVYGCSTSVPPYLTSGPADVAE